MIRAALLLFALAAPIGAAALEGAIPGDAPPRERRSADRASRGVGLSVEGILAGLYEDDPQGSPFVRRTAWGLRVGWNLTERVGLEDTRLTFQPELQWTSRSDSEGTTALVVESRLDSFYLGARLGFRLGEAASAFRVVPYVAAGPAATWNHVRVEVADPAGLKDGAERIDARVDSLQWGAGYGAGVGAAWLSSDGEGITGRLELLRFHRGYLEELALTLGLGVAF
ncbi:MAG TPA: outer membrane beta-barrel protein [Vulgatibacter sp.]|nr:outer membrane beta-barrel protein [Vulgatibacter sp.]